MPLRLLPEPLARLSVRCPACDEEVRPDLFEPKKAPIVPVKPNDVPEDSDARWVPHSMSLNCSRCSGEILVPFPVIKSRTRCQLYGDDASREDEDCQRHVYTYTLVGADWKLIDQVNSAVRALKGRLAPECPADSWALHMKVLWSGQQRKKHPVFAAWDLPKVIEAVDGLFEIMAGTHGLFVFNIAVVSRRVSVEKTKHEAYVSLVMNVIDDLTSQQAQPVLFFDSERASAADRVVHGWARNLFLDSQYCNLYAFLAKGIEVPEPQFVRPASHSCLELADFASYVVARYHFDRWRGRGAMLDPQRLGRVKYIGFERSGDLLWTTQEGYPWEMFYGR